MAIVAAFVIVAAWAMMRRFPDTVGSAEAAVDRPAPRLQEVRSIALDGPKLPGARLREVLSSRAGQPLDTARLAGDRAAMERRLAELGYLAARVEPATVTFDKAGAAYVTFEIDPGKVFHLRNVEVTGAGRDAVVVTLTPGDLAVRDRIESARDALVDALGRRAPRRDGRKPGPTASASPTSVELSVHTDLAAAAVDVTFSTR